MRTIMIIDDELGMVEFLKIVFQKAGFKTVGTNKVQEMAALYEEHAPDIVLLDLNINGANGFDVCKQIKELDSNAKVLFVTGTRI